MSGERLLVVNADDLGLTEGVTAGVLHAARHGIVTSANLMVRAPGAEHAGRAVRALPGLSVGLHLDLAEWAYGPDGWRPLYEVVDTSDAGAVAVELGRQLDRFVQLVGLPPTHLDSHQHVHDAQPVLGLVRAAAARLGVPVRRGGTATYRGDFYGQSGKGEPYRAGISVAALCALVEGLPVGATELGCHPGWSDGLDSVYALEREVEARVLCAPEVLEAVRRSGVRLVPMTAVPAVRTSA